MSTRTITLTDSAPITITEEKWPVIARASEFEHDGQVRSQANVTSEWGLRVRQHEDGRSIVYATYAYSSNYQGARCYSAKRGIVVPKDGDVIAAIRAVGNDIASAEHAEGDAERWPTIVADCIADLPAVAIAE